MRIGLVATLCVLAAAPASAQDLRVAAASDLQAVLPGLVARFEQQTGRRVAVTYGSSGNFFSQIRSGAPFDVFLSADVDYPRRLEQEGVIARGSVTRYAIGRLVLWTRTDSGVDLRRGFDALTAPAVRRIAIANPEHAPYGRAAVAAMRAAGVYDRLKARLVLGENIAQAAQFAQSGNADVGIIALSLTRATTLRTTGTFVEVPAALHPPLEQGAGIVRATRNAELATRFVALLAVPESAAHLQSWGFEVPAASANRAR
jgi:molybdate transport system substrate-binding protein